MVFSWIFEAIKTYFNTPDDKMTNDITSDFWAAICTIFVLLVSVIMIAIVIKVKVSDYLESKRHKDKRDRENNEFIKTMDDFIEKLKKD